MYMCTNRACNVLSIHVNISVYIKNITRLLQYYDIFSSSTSTNLEMKSASDPNIWSNISKNYFWEKIKDSSD